MTKKNSVVQVREPLFHITKRVASHNSTIFSIILKLVSVFIAIFLSCLIIGLLVGTNPFKVMATLFKGCFGTERKRWTLFQSTALLLGVSVAIAPAFKMKFWNLGANGQILVGCLATTACMFYLGGKIPDVIVNILMVICGISAGAIWAVIPAIFKAYFNTNESLFTLMLNYVAECLVVYFLSIWVPNGSGTLYPIKQANLPNIGGNNYLLTIVAVLMVTAIMWIYLKFRKQGYEISVVGESPKTAKYIGINVKAVTIRTLIISGAISGMIGLLLSGSINHTVNSSMAANMGFTAIMSAWLAKFDPLIMIATSFFIIFVSRGMQQIRTDFHFTNDSLTDIIIGIIYFFVIACDFFITYKVVFRKKRKEGNNQ